MAGFQEPEMPLFEVAGSEGTEPPAQMVCEVPKLKIGVRFAFTVTVNVVAIAHWAPEGVKV